MLDTPVPIQSLKLINIVPGFYLDGRPLQGISGSAGTSPPLWIEYSLFRLSLSQSSDWDPYQQKNTRPCCWQWKLEEKINFLLKLLHSAEMPYLLDHLHWWHLLAKPFGNSDMWQSTTVLALATLGDAAQIGSFLFGLHHRHIDNIDSASSTYGSWKLVTTNF